MMVPMPSESWVSSKTPAIQAGVGPQAIDETYVCGNGTQSSTSRFNCVQDPQTFPGKSPAGYRNNHAFSLD